MTEKELHAISDDLFWIHDILSQSTPIDDGVMISQAQLDKAIQKEIVDYDKHGEAMFKYINKKVILKG